MQLGCGLASRQTVQRLHIAALISPTRPSQIDVVTGEKYYQAVAFRDGKMVPGDWKR